MTGTNDITIKQLSERKAKLEREIYLAVSELLRDFEKETKIGITYVDIEMSCGIIGKVAVDIDV